MISIYFLEIYFLILGFRLFRCVVSIYGGLLMMKLNGLCLEINCIVFEEIKKENNGIYYFFVFLVILE